MLTSQGPKCFTTSETRIARCRQQRPGRRLQEQMREEGSGLDHGPITGEACQGPLGTRVLINALSELGTETRAEKRGRGKVTENHEYPPQFGCDGTHIHIFFFFFFICTMWLRLPPSVFEVSPPSPRLAPPTIAGHELLINLGDRKDITALCCALTCLFCEGSVLLPKRSAFAYESVNIILNIKIEEIQRISPHLSASD